jgi:hypothetical protein
MDTDQQPQSGRHGELRAYGIIVAIGLAFLVLLRMTHISLRVVLAFAILALIAAFFGGQLTGPAEYVQISSPNFEQRIRNRYRSQCDQLLSLGFTPLFSYGEATPLYRLLLIYPAFLFLIMWLNREVAAIHNGSRIAFGFPVFISSDQTTYAHPMQLGVKLHTLFQNGAILLSKNFGGKIDYGSNVTLLRNSGVSTREIWSEHQMRVQAIQAAGNLANQQISFEEFARISAQA